MIDEELKKCRRCQHLLPLSQYYLNKKLRGGRYNTCKECLKAAGKANRAAKKSLLN